MDPNATLGEIRSELAAVIHYANNGDAEAATSHAVDLVEYVQALDGWLSRGGFLPAAWNR